MTSWIRGLVCRVVGHCWGWPELYFEVKPSPWRSEVSAVFLRRVWRECLRCHARECDEARCTTCAVTPSFQGPVVGLGPERMEALGAKVKRAMGW